MVTSEVPFPDIEGGVIEWVTTTFGVASGDELPTNYAARLPFVEVSHVGGASDGLSLWAEFEINVFARDSDDLSAREEARKLAFSVCSRMGVYPRNFAGVVSDSVQVTDWPSRAKRLEPDDRTACFSGSLSINLRRF